MSTKRDLLVTLATRARNEWNREKENLLAIIKTTNGGDLHRKISAIFTLDKDVNEEFNMRGRYIDQPNRVAASMERDAMVRFLKAAISKAFLQLLDRRQIYLTVKPEGQALIELEDAEIDAGIRPPRELPPVPATAEELLEGEVLLDFRGDNKVDPPVAPLPAQKFRMKLNGNEAYRRMYEKIASEGRLTSNVTTLTNSGNVGG